MIDDMLGRFMDRVVKVAVILLSLFALYLVLFLMVLVVAVSLRLLGVNI